MGGTIVHCWADTEVHRQRTPGKCEKREGRVPGAEEQPIMVGLGEVAEAGDGRCKD